MKATVVQRFEKRLPDDDDHPYRTGAWRPQLAEWDATELDVVGDLPSDLEGVYLRNTENPLFPSIGRYHPFDGDGMLHALYFHGGQADYRNRFVRTRGLAAEVEAGAPLWAGIIESPESSVRTDGWGARTRLKDASSTDVVVHGGRAVTTHYQCGDAYRMDPRTLEPQGVETWGGRFPADVGISAHPKIDPRTGEMLFFNYGKQAPYMHYGVVSAAGELVHYVPVELPGPRLPHDMAFSEHYAILNDFPSFWDPKLLQSNIHRPRFYRDMPSRFAVIPRRGAASEVRWFEASATYVLHWINAYEDGDELVLDGFHQSSPVPDHRLGDGKWAAIQRMTTVAMLQARAHRWRFNLRTGATKEEFLDDRYTEFPMINADYGGRRHRYAYCMIGDPNWFLFRGLVRYDLLTGTQQRYEYPEGVYPSESPMAPRTGSSAEDDGYVVTFVTDLPNDCSECHVFDARDITRGPIARVRLPERISSGTHAYWASAAELARTRP